MPDEELLLQQLPHSAEAEQAVLGSILIDSRCVPEVIEQIQPDDFFIRENREIYETVYSMFHYSQKIDPVTILNHMRLDGVYREDFSYPYIRQLMETTPTSANVLEYTAIMRDKSLLRRIAEMAREMLQMTQSGMNSASEVLELAEQRVYTARQEKDTKGLLHVSRILIEVYSHLSERALSDSPIPGLSTGIGDIDRVIAGLNPSDLILLAARPGMGKTSLALNILLHTGKFSGKNVAFFSLEMSREQLAMRLISTESFVDNKKLVTGQLDMDDWEKVVAAVESIRSTGIFIDDDSTVTVADINARCRRVKDLGLVIVDYLQLMQSAGQKRSFGENRQQIVSEMSRALKIMAKDLNVPVLCLSQLSRANELRGSNKRPILSDLRDSGAIEQDADIVMFLYREDYYDRETEHHNAAECIIAKNRHGETGTVQLQWLPEFTAFSAIDPYHVEEY